MRVSTRIVVLALAVVVMPRAADAGLLSWLGRMSGPGPFIGVSFGRCIPVNRQQKSDRPVDPQEKPGPDTTHPAAVDFIYCPELEKVERYQPHWTLYLTGGVSTSIRNELQRNGQNGHSVWALDVGAAADYTVHPWLAMGGGAGISNFFGEDFRIFTRPYVEPYVTIRPGLIGESAQAAASESTHGRKLARSFLVTVGLRVLFADLDGASFGAPDDTSFQAHNEGRITLGVGFDLSVLFEREAKPVSAHDARGADAQPRDLMSRPAQTP